MFPLPVGPSNAASQQFGAFRQQQEQRQWEEENPDLLRQKEKQTEMALQHEDEIEDEIDDIERYEQTLSSASAANYLHQRGQAHTLSSQQADSAYPSIRGAFEPLEIEEKKQGGGEKQQEQRRLETGEQRVTVVPLSSSSPTSGLDAAQVVFHSADAEGLSSITSPSANTVKMLDAPAAAPAEMSNASNGSNGTTGSVSSTSPAVNGNRRPSMVGPRSHAEVASLSKTGQLARTGSVSALNEETLHLNAINDADIRKALDPVNEDFSVADLMDWPEEKLLKLVEYVQPQHLPVLMNRRLQVHEKESAKNFSFHHLTFTVGGETILNDVSGYMESGMMVGVLGAPDSGITPLFNILTGREKKVSLVDRLTCNTKAVTLTGDILYDGHKRTADFKRWVGYVVKEDPHLAHLTVSETLYFSARLRLPDMPPKIVRMRVAITLKLLGLSHVANSVVGDGSLRGISGGEKRRVSFGIEMVAGHACIIADLPTNGLDSASAYSLMRTMRFATKIGFSMMASVVQPSPQLLRLFHRVMVMSKGTCIYFGPVSQAEEFFRSAGFIRPTAKALPQFIEELTLKPELFYKPKRYKEMSTNSTPAREQPQPQQQQQPAASPDHGNATAIVIHEDGADKTGPPPMSHNNSVGGAGALEIPDGELKWGDQVLGSKINRSRYAAFMLILNHYKKSIFFQETQQVLQQQEARKQQLKQAHGQDKHRSSSPPTSAAPSTTVSPNDPSTDPAVDPRGWGPLGRWWYRSYNSSPWLQLYMNIYRQTKLTIRNTGLWRDTWLTSIVMGFFLGSLFYQVGVTYQDVRNRVGLFFFILSYLAFNAVMLVPVLAHQREVYYNQLAGGYYHGFAYYISHFLTQIPIVVVETFLLLLPVWGLAGLQGVTCGREFWYAYLVIGFNSMISRIWMILLASLSPNEVYADVLNTVTNIIFTKLCGYFIAAGNIVQGWYWVYVISYFTYALRGLAKNDIWPVTIPACCPGADPTDCPVPSITFGTPENPCIFADGKQALYVIYDIDPYVDKWNDFVNLVWFFIAFNFAAMLVSTYVDWTTLDEPEHPDFGNQMENKHRELHSDIMKSSKSHNKQKGSGKALTNNSPADPKTGNTLAAPSALPPGFDEENEENENANSMTYNHVVKEIDLSKANPLKTKKAYLQFQHLDYTVMVGKAGGGTEPRKLLKQCFGYAKPGELTALMGASGAGKSTLLDVLAGKKTGGQISGDIKVNGQAVDYQGSFSRIAGYVEQFDSHNAFSTVREAIKFSGRLRLPRKTTEDELNAKVDHVMEVLGISHLGDKLIGSPGFGGVSMEVRKKCTIGVELVMEPSLLFLDEPTTGLDSAGAYAVLTSMQLLANGQGMTVVCTIHQPSAELILMFDNIILMMPGGQIAYFGPVHDLPDWFNANHLGELQVGQNPADFALDQVKKAQQGKNVLGQDIDLPKVYVDSVEGHSVQAEIQKGIMPPEEQKTYRPPVLAESQPTLWNQFITLHNRFFLSNIRNRSYIGIRYFLSVFMGFVVGTVFIQLGYSQAASDERVSAIFVTLIFVMFTANAYLPEIFFLRPIYFRETGSKMYQPLAFYMGRFVADIPIVVTEVFILAVMVYFIVNLNPNDNSKAFGLFFLTLLGVRWVSVFFTWAIGTAVELPTNANTLQSTYFNLQMILTGFIIPGPYIGHQWLWLYDLTYLHWGLSFLVANEARTEDVYTCGTDNNEIIPYDSSNRGSCNLYDTSLATSQNNPYYTSNQPNYGFGTPGYTTIGWKCRYECGFDLMDTYGVDWNGNKMVEYQFILWCFGIFFAVLAAFALAYINHIRR